MNISEDFAIALAYWNTLVADIDDKPPIWMVTANEDAYVLADEDVTYRLGTGPYRTFASCEEAIDAARHMNDKRAHTNEWRFGARTLQHVARLHVFRLQRASDMIAVTKAEAAFIRQNKRAA